MLELVDRCDVVVSNFRPGVMERLGLGYDTLVERNPSLVFATGSGYGTTGPRAGLPGQDLLVQAMSGLAANTGGGGPPVATAAAICDASAGFLLAFAIVAGVPLDAQLTGTPRTIDVSLLGAALTLQTPEAFIALNTDLEWQRNSINAGAPWFGAPYGFYATADGWIAVAMTPRDKLAELFELPAELIALDEEAWYQRRDEVYELIAGTIAGEQDERRLARALRGARRLGGAAALPLRGTRARTGAGERIRRAGHARARPGGASRRAGDDDERGRACRSSTAATTR